MNKLRQWFNQLQLSLFDNAPSQQGHQPPTNPPPQAHKPRYINLNGQWVTYQLERASRKTVGMLIDSSGLRVRAHSRVSITEIESILQSRANWIIKHLNQPSKQRLTLVPNLRLTGDDTLSILGQTSIIMRADDRKKFNLDEWFEEPNILKLPQRCFDDQVTDENQLVSVLSQILLYYLNNQARQLADEHQLHYKEIKLSNAKTLWGTCKADGTLRFNWRLVFLDHSLIDYVLAHELSHTREMNHSTRFWAEVQQLCPNYKALRTQLKQYDLRGS